MDNEFVRSFKNAFDFQGLRPCREDCSYSVPGDTDIATEVETMVFVFGLVLTLKPKLVIETGCDIGLMSNVIGQALRLNGFGVLKTCDILQKSVEAVQKRCFALPVNVYERHGVDLVRENSQADLYFLDSAYDSRLEEMSLIKEGLVLVHDIFLDSALLAAVKEQSGYFLIDGPRGIGFFCR